MLAEAMELAIQSALIGVENDEGGPFGAAIVHRQNIIAVTHNTVLKDRDPTCHAEMNAIRLACKQLGQHILDECEIYTTAEPCPMCLSAIYWARIKKIYFAASKKMAKAYGFDDVLFYEEMNLPEKNRKTPCEIMSLDNKVESVFKRWKNLNRTLY